MITNDHDQKQLLVEEVVQRPHVSGSQSTVKARPGKKTSRQEPGDKRGSRGRGEMLLPGLLFIASSICFFK